MLGTLLAAVLAAADPGAAAADVPAFVTIGETAIGGWTLKAETYVEEFMSRPQIGGIYCDAKRNGLSLRAFLDGGFRMDVEGRHPDDEDGENFGVTNVQALVIDGTRYEARWGGRDGPFRFKDVDYPPPPPPAADPPGILVSVQPLMSVLYGRLLVRRPGEAEWHVLDALVDEMLRARRLRIAFRRSTHDHGVEGPLIWAEVPLGELAPALAWCRKTMTSPRALLLHPERAQGQGSKP
jgi:hypothetical protein